MGRFGFVLHGLWPDSAGRRDPRWCRPVPLPDPATIRANLCVTPSADLLAHEWAKHGSCRFSDAPRYFRAASVMFDAVSRSAEQTAELQSLMRISYADFCMKKKNP